MSLRAKQSLTILLLAALLLYGRGAGGGLWPSPEPPAPIAGPGPAVMILEETDERDNLPAGQLAILVDQDWRRQVLAAGGELRCYDASQRPSIDDPRWLAAFDALVIQGDPPLAAISDGHTGYAGPLPATLAEWETLLQNCLPSPSSPSSP